MDNGGRPSAAQRRQSGDGASPGAHVVEDYAAALAVGAAPQGRATDPTMLILVAGPACPACRNGASCADWRISMFFQWGFCTQCCGSVVDFQLPNTKSTMHLVCAAMADEEEQAAGHTSALLPLVGCWTAQDLQRHVLSQQSRGEYKSLLVATPQGGAGGASGSNVRCPCEHCRSAKEPAFWLVSFFYRLGVFFAARDYLGATYALHCHFLNRETQARLADGNGHGQAASEWLLPKASDVEAPPSRRQAALAVVTTALRMSEGAPHDPEAAALGKNRATVMPLPLGPAAPTRYGMSQSSSAINDGGLQGRHNGSPQQVAIGGPPDAGDDDNVELKPQTPGGTNKPGNGLPHGVADGGLQAGEVATTTSPAALALLVGSMTPRSLLWLGPTRQPPPPTELMVAAAVGDGAMAAVQAAAAHSTEYVEGAQAARSSGSLPDLFQQVASLPSFDPQAAIANGNGVAASDDGVGAGDQAPLPRAAGEAARMGSAAASDVAAMTSWKPAGLPKLRVAASRPPAAAAIPRGLGSGAVLPLRQLHRGAATTPRSILDARTPSRPAKLDAPDSAVSAAIDGNRVSPSSAASTSSSGLPSSARSPPQGLGLSGGGGSGGSSGGGMAAPLPARRNVVGVGGAGLDFLASVASFPSPDDKIRTIAAQKLGGGNVANALTAAARLGLSPRILTKARSPLICLLPLTCVADDLEGRQMLAELESDGVDTTHVVVAEGGISPFTYIIVDQETKTRTCIHTAGQPPMTASELSPAAIALLLEGADLVFFDGRLPEAAILVAREAREKGLLMLLDAEKKRDGLDELLTFADCLVASSNFPQPSQAAGIFSAKLSSDMHQAWTGAPDLGDALVSTAVRLPRLRFIVVTLGAAGCAMLERAAEDSGPDGQDLAILDVQPTLDTLRSELVRHRTQSPPPVLASQVGLLSSSSSGPGGRQEQVAGRILVGGAVSLREDDVVDTTGAGDAFIGSILYGEHCVTSISCLLVFALASLQKSFSSWRQWWLQLSAKLLEQGQGFPIEMIRDL
eukprot:SM000114S24122  [mRNA]  locus=s114:81571:87520:- [translate_table: standard]